MLFVKNTCILKLLLHLDLYSLQQWSSRGELSHPRVNKTYSRVNKIFGVNRGVNQVCTVHRKKIKVF